MSIVINSNAAAAAAANNLAAATARLQTSLNKLSSGSAIVNPADDAGGLAVSMKLTATDMRAQAASANVSDAVSFLQTQDGALSAISSILDRVSQLKTLSADPTKNSSDVANYNEEFSQLQAEISAVTGTTFNGLSLFGPQAMAVGLDSDATATMDIGNSKLNYGGSVTDNFSTNFADNSDAGATTSLSKDSAVLTSPGASTYALLQTDQSFSGPMSISATFTMASGGGGQIGIQIGSDINDSWGVHGKVGTHTLSETVDHDGNWTQWLDGNADGSGQFSGYTNPQTVQLYFSNEGAASATLNSATVNYGQGSLTDVTGASDLGSLDLSKITDAIQDVADARATNGAQQSRLAFASQLLTVNRTNIEAARSQITDVDVAAETTNLARQNILVQAGTAMLSQANQSSQVALKLITG